MPQTIRQVFADRIRRSGVLHQLLSDLEQGFGLHVSFIPEPYDPEEQPPLCHHHAALCRELNHNQKGANLCRRYERTLLSNARDGSRCGTCAAQTMVCVVPVPSSAGLLGYFSCAGFYPQKPSIRSVNRIRHLLDRDGVDLSPGQVADLLASTPVVTAERLESIRSLLDIAAGYIVKALSAELFTEARDLPPSIRKACDYIRQHGANDPTLEQTAAAVGLSPSHLSRTFHSCTGLRFKEYVNEVRLQNARRALREGTERIADVAFAVGFRSLSQFNRQFREHYGMAPREYRQRYQAAAPATDPSPLNPPAAQ
jgi:AraC-like DNA-binding protein